MKTRKQYLDGEVSHHDYFAQYADTAIRRRLITFFGKRRILRHAMAEGDMNHRDYIPLNEWDVLTGYRSGRLSAPRSTFEKCKLAGESMTAATMVCIYKAAARLMVDDASKVEKTK
jgi:hypothetical protein